jgi:PhzF family phenazine biosynthesis protein
VSVLTLPIYQIDAFTSRPFGGNPAAVVLLDRWLPDEELQAISAENNLSETAFVVPGEEISLLRWFTPTVEVDLCGHATLAAGHVLFACRYPASRRLRFETRSGVLVVGRDADRLTLDLPARPGKRIEVSDELAAALGVRPREAWLSRDLLAVVDVPEAVESMRPDIERIAGLDVFAVAVSAPGRDVDFVFRFFAPRAGVREDPATGSAHCLLVPYWSERLGKSRLTARQVSRRVGEFECELKGDRVSIAGGTFEFLRGEIRVHDAP